MNKYLIIVILIILFILNNSNSEVENKYTQLSWGNYNYPVCQVWNRELQLGKCAGYAVAAALSSSQSGTPPLSIKQQHILSSYIYFKAQSYSTTTPDTLKSPPYNISSAITNESPITMTGTSRVQLASVLKELHDSPVIDSTIWSALVTKEMSAVAPLTIPTITSPLFRYYVIEGDVAKTKLDELINKGFVCVVSTNEDYAYDMDLGMSPPYCIEHVYGIDSSILIAALGSVGPNFSNHILLICGIDSDNNYIVIDSANVPGISGTKRTYRRDMLISGIIAIRPLWNTTLTQNDLI